MSGAPGPDGRHDDLDADELEGLALLVPDDPRSLDADRVSYLEELRERTGDSASLSRRGRRMGLGRFGISGPTIVLVLACVAVIGSSLTLFTPQATTTGALMAPVATAPPQGVGSIGGLLPDADVMVDGNLLPLRTARPAVIALVPRSCDSCGPTLHSLLVQAREYGLRLVLAGPAAQTGQLDALNTAELGDSARVVIDTDNVLATTYDPNGITALLVHEDGLVAAVVRDVTADLRLESALSQLDRPGATSASP
jgi:hypothetical protein